MSFRSQDKKIKEQAQEIVNFIFQQYGKITPFMAHSILENAKTILDNNYSLTPDFNAEKTKSESA